MPPESRHDPKDGCDSDLKFDSLKFRKLFGWDSLLLAASMDHLAQKTFKLQPTTFSRTLNLSRITKANLIDPSRNETSTDKPVRIKLQDSKPLYIVDGVRIGRTQSNIVLDRIRGASVSSISVYKGQKAIDLYGDEGKDGVIEIRLRPGTSIEEFINGATVQVFSNPTNGNLTISFTLARDGSRVKMVLIDLDGNVVKDITDSTYDNVPTQLHVDVSGYKKGIYILQINIDGAKSKQRVVVD